MARVRRVAMHPRKRRCRRALLCLFAVAGCVPWSVGAQPQLPSDLEANKRFNVRVGSTRTDNLGRDSDPQLRESQTYSTLGVDIGASRAGRRLTGQIDAVLDYNDYRGDRFEDETIGNLNGILDFHIVPSSFDWIFEELLGDVRRDPFSATGPGNRERLNLLATGPEISIPVAAGLSVSVTGRLEDRRWQESDALDSRSELIDAGLVRSIDPTRQFSFRLSTRSIEYDEQFAPPYDVDVAYLNYTREVSTSIVDLSVGTNELTYLGMSEQEPYFSGSMRARIAAYSAFTVIASRQFEDSSDQLRGDFRVPTDRSPTDDDEFDVPLTDQPFIRETIGLTYSLDRPRTTYSINGSWSEETFDLAGQDDRTKWRANLRIRYRFSETTTGRLNITSSRERFDDSERPIRYRSFSAEWQEQFSADWSVALTYEYRDRREANAAQEYDENRLSFSLVWSPFG